MSRHIDKQLHSINIKSISIHEQVIKVIIAEKTTSACPNWNGNLKKLISLLYSVL